MTQTRIHISTKTIIGLGGDPNSILFVYKKEEKTGLGVTQIEIYVFKKTGLEVTQNSNLNNKTKNNNKQIGLGCDPNSNSNCQKKNKHEIGRGCDRNSNSKFQKKNKKKHEIGLGCDPK